MSSTMETIIYVPISEAEKKSEESPVDISVPAVVSTLVEMQSLEEQITSREETSSNDVSLNGHIPESSKDKISETKITSASKESSYIQSSIDTCVPVVSTSEEMPSKEQITPPRETSNDMSLNENFSESTEEKIPEVEKKTLLEESPYIQSSVDTSVPVVSTLVEMPSLEEQITSREETSPNGVFLNGHKPESSKDKISQAKITSPSQESPYIRYPVDTCVAVESTSEEMPSKEEQITPPRETSPNDVFLNGHKPESSKDKISEAKITSPSQESPYIRYPVDTCVVVESTSEEMPSKEEQVTSREETFPNDVSLNGHIPESSKEKISEAKMTSASKESSYIQSSIDTCVPVVSTSDQMPSKEKRTTPPEETSPNDVSSNVEISESFIEPMSASVSTSPPIKIAASPEEMYSNIDQDLPGETTSIKNEIVSDEIISISSGITSDDEISSNEEEASDGEMVSDKETVSDEEMILDTVTVSDEEIVSNQEIVANEEIVSDEVIVSDEEIFSDVEMVSDEEDSYDSRALRFRSITADYVTAYQSSFEASGNRLMSTLPPLPQLISTTVVSSNESERTNSNSDSVTVLEVESRSPTPPPQKKRSVHGHPSSILHPGCTMQNVPGTSDSDKCDPRNNNRHQKNTDAGKTSAETNSSNNHMSNISKPKDKSSESKLSNTKDKNDEKNAESSYNSSELNLTKKKYKPGPKSKTKDAYYDLCERNSSYSNNITSSDSSNIISHETGEKKEDDKSDLNLDSEDETSNEQNS